MAGEKLPIPRAKPLGGWVVLAAIWMVLASLSQARLLLSAYDQASAILSAPPIAQAGLAFSVLGTAILFVAFPVWALVLLTDRSPRFPKAYLAWAILAPIFVLLDQLFAYLVYKPLYDSGAMLFPNRGFITAAFGCLFGLAVWVPYFLKSRHVKQTFTS